MNVPQGQSIIARRFNAGSASSHRRKSRRDGRNNLPTAGCSVVPPGLFSFYHVHPPLKRRAIVIRPVGAAARGDK